MLRANDKGLTKHQRETSSDQIVCQPFARTENVANQLPSLRLSVSARVRRVEYSESIAMRWPFSRNLTREPVRLTFVSAAKLVGATLALPGA